MPTQNSSNVEIVPGGTATYTFPVATDTLVGRASVDTLSNKTLDEPMIGDETSIPAAPSAGLKLYSIERADRRLLGVIGPSGLDYSLQPSFFSQQISMYQANGGNATGTFLMNMPTITQYQAPTALAQTATSGILGAATRLRYPISATTTAGIAGWRFAVAQWYRGHVASAGGFYAVWRFGIPGITSNNHRFFCGMSATTGAFTAAQPNTFLNFIGVIKDSADTVFHLAANDGTGTATKIATTISASTSATKMYEVRVFCAPNASSMAACMIDLETGTVSEGTFTDIPSNTTFLCPQIWANNSVATPATPFALDFQAFYIESDN